MRQSVSDYIDFYAIKADDQKTVRRCIDDYITIVI